MVQNKNDSPSLSKDCAHEKSYAHDLSTNRSMNNDPLITDAETTVVPNPDEKSIANLAASQRFVFFSRHVSPVWGRMLAGLVDVPVISMAAAVISVTTPTTEIDPLFGPIMTAMLASFLYHTALEMSPWQATLGKRITGLRTVRLDGKAPCILQVLGRSLIRWLEWMLLGVPYLICLFVPHRATIHDFVTRTRTIATADVTDDEQSQLASAPAKVWSLPEKLIAGVTYLVLVVMLMTFAMAVKVTAMVRESVTDAFQDVRGTMRLIEGFHAASGRFPPSLDDVGGPVVIRSPNLGRVLYTAENGTLVLKFTTKMAVIGLMYVVPIVGADLKRPKEITWMCAGTGGFIQSYLPTGCMTISGLALQRIRDQADR